MARGRRSYSIQAPGSSSWTAIPLADRTARELDLLRLDGKMEGGEAHLRYVRDGRFADSFMMATNGGSSHEPMLRPSRAQPQLAAVGRAPARSPRGGLQNVIGDHDERVRIDDTSLMPARSIGLLRIKTQSGQELWGTAWLIGPRTLVTAAHNVLDPTAGPAKSLDVAMAYDGTNARGGWHHVVDNRVPVLWQENPSAENPFDFAVLRIEDASVGNKLGWFGYSDYEDAKFTDLAVNLYGYPLDKMPQFSMFGSIGRVLDVGERRIRHDCDSAGGVSGGPLLAKFGDRRIAVGVHVDGGDEGNFATRITAEAFLLFEEFRSW